MWYHVEVPFISRKYSILFRLIPIFGLIGLFFTNCKFEAQSYSNDKSISVGMKGGGSGNGESYDGKIYNRKVPGGGCDGQSMPIGQIQIAVGSVILTKNSGSTCGETSEISESEILFSKNTDVVISFQDGLFTKQFAKQDQLSEVFTETWCRGLTPKKQSIDVVVTWDTGKKSAEMAVYSGGEGAPPKINTVNRRLKPATVLYGTDKSGYLEVNFIKPLGDNSYDRSGVLITPIDGVWTTLNLLCRMGGEFDSEAPKLKYSREFEILPINRPVSDFLEPVFSHPSESYTISPPLPSGLVFSAVDGGIRGTPNSPSPMTVYQIEARLRMGTVTTHLELGVGNELFVSSRDFTSGLYLSEVSRIQPIPSVIFLPNELIRLGGNELVFSGAAKFIGGANTIIDGEQKSRLIRLLPNSTLILDSLELVNGQTKTMGGAIYSEASSLRINNVRFFNNSILLDPEFSTSQMGGAVYATGGRIEVVGSLFEGNSVPLSGANLYGGAIAIDKPLKPIINIVASKFVNNSAGYGGAVYAGGNGISTLFSFENCEFDSNRALSGGAVFLTVGLGNFVNSKFSSNSALVRGGALTVYPGPGVWIEQSQFLDNSAREAPSVYFFGLYSDSTILMRENTLDLSQVVVSKGYLHAD